MTVMCQIWTLFRLVSEFPESQQNRPDGKTRSASGTVELSDSVGFLNQVLSLVA